MELNYLESFILAAEHGSFTRAAARRNYSQSTISFQIKQLEKELGTPLFERMNHTVRLTPKGSEILALAYRMVALRDAMEKTAGDSRPLSGHIRLAMADSLCQRLFRDSFGAFRRMYPDISLKIFTASTEEMFRLLKQNEVDMVYTLDRHIYDSRYVIAYEEQVGVHVIAPPDHPLCAAGPVTLAQLAAQPFILTEKGMSYRNSLDEQLAKQSLEIRPFLELGDATLICRLVEQGMGLSFLPDYITGDAARAGRVRRLETADFSPGIWLQLLYHRDKWRSPEMQCVIRYLESRLPKKAENTQKQAARR